MEGHAPSQQMRKAWNCVQTQFYFTCKWIQRLCKVFFFNGPILFLKVLTPESCGLIIQENSTLCPLLTASYKTPSICWVLVSHSDWLLALAPYMVCFYGMQPFSAINYYWDSSSKDNWISPLFKTFSKKKTNIWAKLSAETKTSKLWFFSIWIDLDFYRYFWRMCQCDGHGCKTWFVALKLCCFDLECQPQEMLTPVVTLALLPGCMSGVTPVWASKVTDSVWTEGRYWLRWLKRLVVLPILVVFNCRHFLFSKKLDFKKLHCWELIQITHVVLM